MRERGGGGGGRRDEMGVYVTEEGREKERGEEIENEIVRKKRVMEENRVNLLVKDFLDNRNMQQRCKLFRKHLGMGIREKRAPTILLSKNLLNGRT